MPDQTTLTHDEMAGFLQGLLATGVAIQKKYAPPSEALTDILRVTGEAAGVAYDMHPAEVFYRLAQQALDHYTAEAWQARQADILQSLDLAAQQYAKEISE